MHTTNQHTPGFQSFSGLCAVHYTQNKSYRNDRPTRIAENGYCYQLFYGPDDNRIVTELRQDDESTAASGDSILLSRRFYSLNYELLETTNGDKYQINYIPGGDGLAAIYVTPIPSGGAGGGPGACYYVYKDHLGSILTLTDDEGEVVFEQNFDAWGNRRNATDWTYETAQNSSLSGVEGWLNRGYTGHEMLPHFGLVNMNNRLYDPLLGRFLAVDNYVQDPFSSQGYNRFSYCFNNPLKYTDPSGEITMDAWMYNTLAWGNSDAAFGAASMMDPPTGGLDLVAVAKALFAGVKQLGKEVVGLKNVEVNVTTMRNDGNRLVSNLGDMAQKAAKNVSSTISDTYNKEVAKNASSSTNNSFVGQGGGSLGGNAQGGGGNIDWNQVGNGAMTLTGGTLATVGGVAAGFTGVGTPLGITIAISTGIPTMGLGIGIMVNGFRGGKNILPGGVAETVDRAVGGNGTVGQLIDLGSGGIPKTLLDASMFGYGLYNSNFSQMMLSRPQVGGSYIAPIAPSDNTRIVIPALIIKKQ